MNAHALRAIADAADALARLARAAVEDAPGDASALVPLAEAARAAGTSVRVVRDAIRAGDLAAYGRQRDRSVRRGELERWVESRRSKPVAGADDIDIERRVLRLARTR